MHLRDRNSAIERHHWRRIDRVQQVVQRKNLAPVSGLVTIGQTVTGGNSCLKVKIRKLRSGGGLVQIKQAPLDHGLVPSRAILILEKQHVPVITQSRGETRCLEQHQRMKRVTLWGVARRMG